MKFWIPWFVSACVTGCAVVFFFIGLGDGTVSSYNGALWAGLLAGTLGVSIGSLALRRAGHIKMAIGLTMVLAIPGALGAFLMVMVLISPPRWN